MSETPLHFDFHLQHMDAARLKSIAKAWSPGKLTQRAEFIQAIRAGLESPAKIREFLGRLQPYEGMVLALLKQNGGEMDAAALAASLWASGVTVPSFRTHYGNIIAPLIDVLIQHGLILNLSLYSPGAYDAYVGANQVFSDARLLAEVADPALPPLALPAAPAPARSLQRQPAVVVLEVLSLLRTVEEMGGIQINQNGTLRAGDLKKLAKAMEWKQSDLMVDGQRFPDIANAIVHTLRYRMLTQLENLLVLASPLSQFSLLSYDEQVRPMVEGFLNNGFWLETGGKSMLAYQDRYPAARHAVLTLLQCLAPTLHHSRSFIPLDEFDRVLFDRLGPHFSLTLPLAQPHNPRQLSPQETARQEAEWRQKLRSRWLQQEQPWLTQVFTTWLYYLGLVELGLDAASQLISFRITDLGWQLLHPQDQSARTMAPQQAGPAWIVQPNFEIMVYLDRTTSEQLVFLEIHADRLQVHQHMAQYRLTKDSIYRGLERGSTLETLMQRLQAGSQSPIPQNVRVDMEQWSNLREEMTLWCRGHLLEFEDEASRSGALVAGLPGTPVGDRFLHLTPQQHLGLQATYRIDYAFAFPPCLSVSEEGLIEVTKGLMDLILPAQLDRWADRLPQNRWQLTQAKASQAAKAGAKVNDFLALLQSRSKKPLPALVPLTLQAWAGQQAAPLELGKITVLRCFNGQVLNTIADSAKLKPYIIARLSGDTLLVDAQKLPAFKQALGYLGLKFSDLS